MTAYTIHATKDGETVTTVRIGPTITVAKARTLMKQGWQVHVTDGEGHRYGPEKLDQCYRLIAEARSDFEVRLLLGRK